MQPNHSTLDTSDIASRDSVEGSMPRDDAALLARAGRGDQAAYAELYNKYESDLYRFALYLTGGPDVAEELYQETWFRVVKHLGKKPVANFKQWLFTIAANLYRDELRKRKVRRQYADENTGTPYTKPAADSIAIRDALHAAMEKLSDQQRAAFVLVYVQGFKIREAGEILDKPEGTVKSTLYRALELLRAELKEIR
jgi:RNA polymerase sigma-70 factor (ECF subfamily)